MGTPVSVSAPPSTSTAPKTSWLKKFGQVVWTAAKDVIGFVGSPKVQTIEQQVAAVASLILPAEAPLIQAFQAIAGKIFQQVAVTETQFANVAVASGSQKLSAVVASIGPELDAWVANNFPGTTALQASTKAGLVNAIVALQNDLTAPTASPVANPQPAKTNA